TLVPVAYNPACANPYAALASEVVADDAGAAAPPVDPRVEEALKLAEETIAAGDNRGYLLKGEALTLKGRWTEGLMLFVEGIERLCPEHARGLALLVKRHPAFARPDTIQPPDPGTAEGHYAVGLRYYFDRRYQEAEEEFLLAVKFNDQDARYLYFLGLS